MVRYILGGLGLAFVAALALGPAADAKEVLGAVLVGGFVIGLLRPA